MDKVKALFFAQYLGQEIYMQENMINPVNLWAIHLSGSNKGWILLSSIKDLTDGEAFIIAEFTGWAIPHDGAKRLAIADIKKSLLKNENMESSIKDCLKLFGILTPFTYLDETNKPITIQPEAIIELGWAKYIN